MSSGEKTRINVDIFGTSYKLVGKSSVSYMKMVAAHVNDQMYHISNAIPHLEFSKIAVLASVNIADEFFKLSKEFEQLQSESQKSLDLEEKYGKVLQQSNQLQLENQGLQAELQAALQQLNSLELAEQQKLQEENAELRDQHLEDLGLVRKHMELTAEYEKLKKEYNEMIQLVMEGEEPS